MLPAFGWRQWLPSGISRAVTTRGALEGGFNHTSGIIPNRRPETVVRLNQRTCSPVAPPGQPHQDDHCAAGARPVPGTENFPPAGCGPLQCAHLTCSQTAQAPSALLGLVDL